MCHCTLLPHWCTQRGDSGFLVCSHHPAGGQVTKPELLGSVENRLRGSSKAVRSLGESAVSSATGYIEGTQSGDKLASEAADREEKGGEETGAEGADSTASGQRLADPSDPTAPAVADAAVEEAESCGAASSPLDATVQQEVTQRPPELSTCKQEQVGDHGPASGCVPGPSVVPVAPPRASTSQTTNSSLVAGEKFLFIYLCQYLSLHCCPFQPAPILLKYLLFLSSFLENSASQCTCSARLQRR